MAKNDFQYIIKTELQLNTGSINKLLSQVKEVDKQIKEHFDTAKGGGLRVPLSVNADITKLQGEVKKTIEGYQKGQVPSIKIPLTVDENSIRKLQTRISELKKQINSLAEDKKTISVNTSLKVGAGEKESIQKQVGDTKATINVGLRLNEQDIKVVKAQIESIKAEIKASVSTAVQEHAGDLRRVGAHRTDSPVNNARNTINRQQGNRAQQSKRDFDEARLYYRQMADNIKSQIKSEQELQHLRNELDRAKNPSKARKTDNMTANNMDGTKSKVSVTQYTKQLEDELKKQARLLQQLKRAEQATEIAKQKAGSFTTPQVQKSLTRLNTTPTEQDKVIQQISRGNAKSAMEQRIAERAEQQAINDAKYKARKQRQQQRNNPAPVTTPIDNRSLDEKYYDTKNNRVALENALQQYRASIGNKNITGNANKRRVLDNIKKMQDDIQRAVDEETQYHNEIMTLTSKTPKYRQALQSNFRDPYKEASDRIRNNNTVNWNRSLDSYNQRQAEEEARRQQQADPNFGRVNDVNDAHRQANQMNSVYNRNQRNQQRANDYRAGIRRFGPNGEYSGIDLEQLLKNPNVSLDESLGILKNQIIPNNRQIARSTGQNFQRAYTINYQDTDGQIHSMRTLTYEFTKYGEAVERGDRSFKTMISNMVRNSMVYSMMAGGFYAIGTAVGSAVQQLVDFDSKMANIKNITSDLNGNNVASFFQNFGSGTNTVQSNISNQAFSIGEQYGVSTADTVMPIESQVMARTNLITGYNGKADPNMQKKIVDNIIKFSAVSTGGNATSEEVNGISQDVLSLYQAMYTKGDPTAHMNGMDSVLNYLASMKKNGVNTNAVTDALSELAPDTISAGIDTKKVAAMLGSYNLSDTDATGANMTQIAKTFFGALDHPDNPNIQKGLRELGIDTQKHQYNTPELLDLVLKKFASKADDPQAQKDVAEAFASLTGQGKAMTPKMVKFLQASTSDYTKEFDKSDSPEALQKSWQAFSNTLKKNFAEAVEQVKQLVELLGKLGAMDFIGLLVKGFTALLKVVNGVLMAVDKLGDFFKDDLHIPNFPKMATEIASVTLAFKGLAFAMNKLNPTMALLAGDWLASKTGKRFGFKGLTEATMPLAGRAVLQSNAERYGGRVIQSPFIPTIASNPRVTGQSVVRTGEQILADMATYSASDALAYRLANGHVNPTTSYIPTIAPNSRVPLATLPRVEVPKLPFKQRAGNYLNDLFMVQQIKNFASRGGATAVEEGAVKSGGILSSLFTKMASPIGLIVTRFGLLAVAMWGAYEVIKKMHDAGVAHQQAIDKKQTDNFTKEMKELSSDPKKSKTFNNSLKDWVNLNNKLVKGSPEAYGEGTMDYSSPEGKKLKKLDDKFREMGIQYYASLGKASIKYKATDSNKKTTTMVADTDNKAEMQQFYDSFKNHGQLDTKLIKDYWAVNTKGVVDYNQALADTEKLTGNVNRTMALLGYNISQIDAKYMGANSTSSLKEKMGAIQNGLGSTASDIKKIKAENNKIQESKNSTQDLMNKQIAKMLNFGISKKEINSAQEEYNLEKMRGDTSSIMNKYKEPTANDQAKWKAQGMTPEQIKAKTNEQIAMRFFIGLIDTLSKITDAGDKSQQALIDTSNAQAQYNEQLKQTQAQLYMQETGFDAINAKIGQIQSRNNMGSALVQMSRANSPEQIDAQGNLISASGDLLKAYQSQLGNISQQMAQIRASHPDQDFSINSIYNPNGQLTAEQSIYKDLLDKQISVQDSVTQTTQQMYDQAQQLKDMVLNSVKYASVWERVQARTALVKQVNNDLFNNAGDMHITGALSNVRSAVTGTPYQEIRNSKMTQIRDTNLDNYDKLMSALNTYGSDSKKLQEAYQEINKSMGSEFDQAFINPLKDLVKNDFAQAGKDIKDGADSLNNILSYWYQMVQKSSSNPSSVAGQTQSFNNALAIPQGSADNRTFAQKEQAYLEQMGYKVGTQGYAQMKRQLEASYSHDDLVKEVNNNTIATSNNGAVGDYSSTINKYLKGSLSGYGSTFVQYGAQYGIDPRLMASIAMSETGGNSDALNNLNNVAGIMGKSGQKSYSSISDSIADLARILKQVYFDQGLTTIPDIQSKYAPYNANNDPNHLNDNWRNNVSSYYSKMTGISQSELLGGTAVTSNSTSTASGTKNSSYTGGSIVDYLSSVGQSTSFSHRKDLAKQYGISNYSGTASQNTTLLNKMRASNTSSSPSTSSVSGSGSYSAMDSWFSSVKGNGSKMTYSWGGAHVIEDWTEFLKKGIADCSGLVEQVYRKFAGINLGTTSSQGIWNQNDGGKQTRSKADLKPGDLVFFGSNSGSIHHVGIYAGGDEMWTIDHSGTPVSKDKISSWGDFYGGKHYSWTDKQGSGSVGSLMDGQSTQLDMLKTAVSSFIQAMQAQSEINTPQQMKDQYYKDTTLSYGQGNVTDIMGTSGRIAVADRITQERANIYEQKYANVQQLQQLNTARKNYVNSANLALASGKTDEYNVNKDAIDQIDKLISTLEKTNKTLDDWDATMAKTQQYDPRYNYDKSMGYIKGGYDKLNSMDSAGQAWSPDYIKLLGEMSTMLSTYDTHAKNTELAGNVWSNSGQQTSQFINAKKLSDQDSINLMMDKITKINSVLKQFAEGSQAWYTTLEEAVKVEQQLHDLEQQRLQNAQSMFELTGSGLQGYIKQKAYTQSKDYAQAGTNLQSAIQQYQSGKLTPSYSLSTGGFKDNNSAQEFVDMLKNNYGIDSSIVNEDVKMPNGKLGKMTKVKTTSELTQDRANEVSKALNDKGIGYGVSVSSGSTANMDMNQQLANLQIISGLHDQMIQQMNDYRSAVVGAFKAGAMSLDEYMKKMNDLRDVQNEAKENATKMVDALSSGFQDAFSNALSGGMMGDMNSTQGFIDSMKQTFAQSISSSLASSIFNNSGLLDVTNGLIKNITNSATSGSPTDIANMFNNNDFKTQFNDALAPFLPLINQIVASTQGMFTIMKNQVFNAPNGFKIDSEVAKVASAKGIGEVRQWDPTGKNSAGSTDSTTGTTNPIVIPPSSSTPSGVPTSTSGGGTNSTGAPEGTSGSGTGAPNSGSAVSPPAKDNSTIVGVATITADDYAGLYQRPKYWSGYFIKKLPHGSQWKAYAEHDGWINVGGGWVNKKNVSVQGDIPKYHTGGLAGMLNFSNPNRLKPDEISAVLKKGEPVLTQKQVSSLVNSTHGGNGGGDVNFNITVNVEGGGQDEGTLQATIKTAVEKAIQAVKKDQRFTNLTWKGTSY